MSNTEVDEIETMLLLKKWAVIGATNNSTKFGYKIYKAMKAAGYDVAPVNPGLDEVLGDHCYASLRDLAIKPEAVDIVAPPKAVEQILCECAELGIKNVWLQPGANSPELVAQAKQLGLQVIYQNCILREMRKRQ